MKSILIVEDHEDAMARMKRIIATAFQASNIVCVTTIGKARLEIEKQFFDLAVIDLALPDGNGETLVQEITGKSPSTYIVISTIHDESERLLTALESGARGYLLKEQPQDFLVEEFRGILRGKPPLAPAITRRLMEMVKSKAGNSAFAPNIPKSENQPSGMSPIQSETRLTEREKQVLQMVAKGLDRSEIARVLGISRNTVSSHISKIYSKLDIRNRAEAALVAQQLDLI